MDMRNWDLFDKLMETLGGEKLAEEFIRCMASDTANRYLESIAREYDIEYEEEWEICRIVVTTKEICNWYDEYSCDDGHITSLFIAACRKTGLL